MGKQKEGRDLHEGLYSSEWNETSSFLERVPDTYDGKENVGFDKDIDEEEIGPPPATLSNISPLDLSILITGFIIALMCGTPNAFALVSEPMQEDLGLEQYQVDLITSFGIVGLFFTVPVGMFYDFAGAYITIFLCGGLASIGYTIMSFCGKDLWWLIMLSFMVTGFGSGGAFNAVLGTAIKSLPSNPGLAISFVGAGMSLSMGFATVVFIVVEAAAECPNDNCWQAELQALGVLMGIVTIPGAIIYRYLLSKKQAQGIIVERPSIQRIHESESEEEELSFVQKLSIINNKFYVVLEFAYMVGIGGAVAIISQLTNIWDAFIGEGSDRSSWATWISLGFSLINAFIGGMVFGAFCDHMVLRRNYKRYMLLGVLFIIYSGIFLGMAALSIFDDVSSTLLQVLMLLLMVAVGGLFGACVNTFPTIIGETYDIRYFGVYLGFLQVGSAVSTFLVPYLCSVNFDQAGNASVALSSLGILLLFSGGGLLLVKAPRKD
mmetsp:Transcript_5542/g.15690  ORF Transcript_5542/g.15690 Transcript_5542/m.15690 type:complete len:492 (+) Transcript_5542:97-1572(+)|eukprot:CAMPEP_0119122564 /NCGR_PEP_ID=MMETSP1310-20130426/2789_1 /TAXON_ID=464262 /ORGANISM="Genus nov. species nov., Strain RCC2339" /LENGTH=491 /DNA_ID=CAMNT_0007112243 /DNA_START=94 /DNA_END=1569 /DNA_ORIENTATION=+